MPRKHPNEGVPIMVLPSPGGKACSAADRKRVQQVVREKLLLTSMEVYGKAQVEVHPAKDGTTKELRVSLLRAYSYTADLVRVTVDSNYAVISIERDRQDD